MRVDIETGSLLCGGQSICDVWGQSGRAPNAVVAKVKPPLQLQLCQCQLEQMLPMRL